MFLWLWTFFRGYVAINVTGSSVERFLNMAAHRGIYIWDIKPIPNGVQMHCSIKGFKMLRSCVKKTKCRIKISQRFGFPFVMHRYRKRKILMGGIAFFILFLFAMSSFVWQIDIEGNERIEKAEILDFVATHGLESGTFKHFINHSEITQALLLNFSDISWADVYTRGTRTTIIISETIPQVPTIPWDIPCHIIASRDGLITSIVTASGTPKVRQNDVVRAGDILVSSAVTLESEHTGQVTVEYVHAYAEVWAKMYTPIRLTIPLAFTYREYIGNIHRQFSIEWLILRPGSINNIFYSRIPFDNYGKIVSHTQLGANVNYPLPFIWTTTTYEEFIPQTRHRTVDEAKIMADRIITERIIREFDFQADIINKQIHFEQQDEQLVVSVLITTNERIDKSAPVQSSLDNPLN